MNIMLSLKSQNQKNKMCLCFYVKIDKASLLGIEAESLGQKDQEEASWNDGAL